MFQEHTTEEIIKMVNENTEVIQDKEGITIKIKNETSLKDLKQNIINFLNSRVGKLGYCNSEVELLKILLEYEK